MNCHDDDIISQLEDCSALLWHFHHNSVKDSHIARQILFSLEQTGFKVFPDFRTSWHFDDKVGQKYLLERLGAPFVPSHVFVNKKEALNWVSTTNYPKVFKLKGGAGSQNVLLVNSREQAKKIVKKAFSSGFSNYNAWGSLKERTRMWRSGKASIFDVIKGIARVVKPPEFAKGLGVEYGYVYFQDFIPNNDSDTRIIVIDGKAFALKRYVRENDFRASGSGFLGFDKKLFNEDCIALAFKLTKGLNAQCVAYDFIFDSNKQPLLVEISYGFSPDAYDVCPGYWDESLRWFEGEFNPQGWIIDSLIK
ncbi:hypothetical protein GCM10007424_10080 [Flavobacterium suaedae]|uniref:ATP-grasp domain-containing protein n=1 Tax=Flavobacterium suaedae TaxID=1767027 RepID=A0ABQ1JLI5_9FLAO|nr:hypothetical protein GCM10007424_10080 [Flavobacterium suaedae]